MRRAFFQFLRTAMEMIPLMSPDAVPVTRSLSSDRSKTNPPDNNEKMQNAIMP